MFFLRNVSYNESYGHRLAQTTGSVNHLVSTSTLTNLLGGSDRMMGMITNCFHRSEIITDRDKSYRAGKATVL